MVSRHEWMFQHRTVVFIGPILRICEDLRSALIRCQYLVEDMVAHQNVKQKYLNAAHDRYKKNVHVTILHEVNKTIDHPRAKYRRVKAVQARLSTDYRRIPSRLRSWLTNAELDRMRNLDSETGTSEANGDTIDNDHRASREHTKDGPEKPARSTNNKESTSGAPMSTSHTTHPHPSSSVPGSWSDRLNPVQRIFPHPSTSWPFRFGNHPSPLSLDTPRPEPDHRGAAPRVFRRPGHYWVTHRHKTGQQRLPEQAPPPGILAPQMQTGAPIRYVLERRIKPKPGYLTQIAGPEEASLKRKRSPSTESVGSFESPDTPRPWTPLPQELRAVSPEVVVVVPVPRSRVAAFVEGLVGTVVFACELAAAVCRVETEEEEEDEEEEPRALVHGFKVRGAGREVRDVTVVVIEEDGAAERRKRHRLDVPLNIPGSFVSGGDIYR